MDEKPVYPHIGLPLPDLSENAETRFKEDTALEAFVDELPLADAISSGEQLLNSLQQLTQAALSVERQVIIINRLMPLIRQTLDGLKKHFVPANFPLSKKTLALAELSCKILLNTALTHKRVISQSNMQFASEEDKQSLATSIFCCISSLYEYLQIRALTYQLPEEHVWVEIHQLFRLANKNKLDRVSGCQNDDSNQLTIKKIYKHLLVFSLARPNQMGQSEMQELIHLMPEIDADIGLLVIEPSEKKHDFGFYINLSHDQAAVHVSSLPEDLHHRILLLQTGKLLKKLTLGLQTANTAETPLTISPHLHELLLRNLGYASHRQVKRTRHKEQLRIICGLENINSWLRASPSNNQTSDSDNKPRPSVFIDDDDDLTVLTLGIEESTSINRGTLLTPKEIDHDAPIDANELFAEDKPATYENSLYCDSLDQSSLGHRLQWSAKNLPAVTVGDIIGIVESADKRVCSLHIVRWLHQQSDQLYVGTEMLGERTLACEFKLKKSAKPVNPKQHHKALMIPETQERALQIIMHKGLFEKGDQIFLAPSTDHRQAALLRKNKESSELFDRFLVRLI